MEKLELSNKLTYLEAETKRQAAQSERDAVSRQETKAHWELFQKRETQEGVQNAMQKVVAEFNDKLVEKDRVNQQHMKNKKKKQEEKQAAAAARIANAEETARKASETEKRKKSKRRRERSYSRSSESSGSDGGRRKRSFHRNRRRTHSPDRRRDRSSMGNKQRRRSSSRSRADTENIDKAPPPPKSNNPPTPLVPAKVTLADIQNWTGVEVNNWLIEKGLNELGQLCSNSGLLRNGLFLVQSAKALSGIRQKIIANGIEDEEADLIVQVFETALTDLISQK